jgi:hypothetical protein
MEHPDMPHSARSTTVRAWLRIGARQEPDCVIGDQMLVNGARIRAPLTERFPGVGSPCSRSLAVLLRWVAPR